MNDAVLAAGKLVTSKVTSAFPVGTLVLPLTACTLINLSFATMIQQKSTLKSFLKAVIEV